MIHRTVRGQLLLVCATLALTCALVFAPDAYLPMLVRSFLLWWAFGLLLLGVIAAWRKRWWLSLTCAICSAAIMVQIRIPTALAAEGDHAHGLRVAHMNVWQMNTDHAGAISAVLASDPDLISVQEVSPEWAVALARGFARTHPYRHVVPQTNCYGIALFSRFPLLQAQTIEIAGAQFIEAEVMVSGQAIRVLAVHATSPISYAHFRRRNAQLVALADRIARSDFPTLLIGDLNTVHWDQAYQRFCARSGARPINSPYQITWPSVGPLAMIPIDHALVSGGLCSSSITSFKVAGSDHRGLLAEVHLAHAR
ncbi:MAG: endonuclease/exonuclease/phosphatase family protein [Flavobacteriales bacterium]|nr:endonuclease/exonuclease/phosphatase family protein [Flavobacteriales bacterium]